MLRCMKADANLPNPRIRAKRTTRLDAPTESPEPGAHSATEEANELITADVIARVNAGEKPSAIAADYGVARNTIAAVAARLPVRPATFALMRERRAQKAGHAA